MGDSMSRKLFDALVGLVIDPNIHAIKEKKDPSNVLQCFGGPMTGLELCYNWAERPSSTFLLAGMPVKDYVLLAMTCKWVVLLLSEPLISSTFPVSCENPFGFMAYPRLLERWNQSCLLGRCGCLLKWILP